MVSESMATEDLRPVETLMGEKGFIYVPRLSPSWNWGTYHHGPTLIEAELQPRAPNALAYTLLSIDTGKVISPEDLYPESYRDKSLLFCLEKRTDKNLLLSVLGSHNEKVHLLSPTYFNKLSQLKQTLDDLSNIQQRIQKMGAQYPTKLNLLCKRLFTYIHTNPDISEMEDREFTYAERDREFTYAERGPKLKTVQLIHSFKKPPTKLYPLK